jgi:NADH pyrophosphatase NudC (nudix superfamily)
MTSGSAGSCHLIRGWAVPDFFETVKQKIGKGVTTVSVKSKEVLETTQLRSQLKTLQDEKQQGLEELGSITYTLFVQGKLEEETERISSKCEKLAALDQRIREKEEEIRQVHMKAQEALGGSLKEALAICECGAPIYEGIKFCGGCGKRVEEIVSQAQRSVARCAQCGAPLATGVRFCGNCGFKAGNEKSP